MTVTGRLADIAQKSAVLLLAGTTVYYMVNVGMLVNRRMELKKEGRLHDELTRLNTQLDSKDHQLHAETPTTPTPLPDANRPGP
ncbi:hypothetical protein A0J61_07248 [Choanephora cucurbitarum]|uniref:Uncharacterized protein n=1 Tax=Choanephora cucurbitarum TaxID=101091 RepID=A0A1C7N6N6_9FUNG|nr:hypothetical protein A0J61_07248 [Choanephora cucurbitarum]